MKLQYFGITTNNVKNVNIEIEYGEVVFFSGPSGSGKSSIAVDTIHKISEDELFQLIDSREDISFYTLRDYENILPSVCLQQENYNRNPRSTIATYFGLDTYFKELFSSTNSVSQKFFQFNSTGNSCEACHGSGTSFTPDPLTIIDFPCRICDIPFRNWRASHSEYHRQALVLFCHENGIDPSQKFHSLSEKSQDLLLNSESTEKNRIEYSANGRKHRKTGKYKGPILELREEIEKDQLPKHKIKYLGQGVCPKCDGSRFSGEALKFELYGKNIGQVYLMEIDLLANWIRKLEPRWTSQAIEARAFQKILRFLDSLTRLNLNYLNLNRSIPTLSGGELQRLRLGKAINSHFTNFIFVLDEPTSGLHPSEWEAISEIVNELKQRQNTILIIEHNEFLKKVSDRVVSLGPGGGKNGGNIISPLQKNTTLKSYEYRFFKSSSFAKIENASSNNIKNVSLELPLKTILGVCGVSGSGKTSFLKGILPKYLEGTQYFSQAPIRGNSYSIVATAMGILNDIQLLFSKKTKASKEYFVFSSKGKGQCDTCFGKGILEEESSYINETILCPTCSGKRFSNNALKFKFGEFNIHQFLNLSIDEIIPTIPGCFMKLKKGLELLSRIGLGYLTPFQNISTLSGGEAQRIKFAGRILEYKTKQIYLLDEPFRGVDRENIRNIIQVLYSLVEDGATVFIAEHNPFALQFCSFLLELGPGSGKYGGKILFLGEKEKISRKGNSMIAPFLSNQ